MDTEPVPEWISIGTLSERTGVTLAALYFYERKGLIKSQRNNSNQRQYSRFVIRVVSLILLAQKIGFSLDEILTEINQLSNSSQVTLSDWEKMGVKWRSELNNKIQQLTDLRDLMTDCIGCGCLSLDRCKLLNPSDKLGEKGAGAHLLSK